MGKLNIMLFLCQPRETGLKKNNAAGRREGKTVGSKAPGRLQQRAARGPGTRRCIQPRAWPPIAPGPIHFSLSSLCPLTLPRDLPAWGRTGKGCRYSPTSPPFRLASLQEQRKSGNTWALPPPPWGSAEGRVEQAWGSGEMQSCSSFKQTLPLGQISS